MIDLVEKGENLLVFPIAVLKKVSRHKTDDKPCWMPLKKSQQVLVFRFVASFAAGVVVVAPLLWNPIGGWQVVVKISAIGVSFGAGGQPIWLIAVGSGYEVTVAVYSARADRGIDQAPFNELAGFCGYQVGHIRAFG